MLREIVDILRIVALLCIALRDIANISGGEISENVCGINGGGIHINNRGVLNISGNPIINRNKKGDDNNNVFGGVDVTGSLTDGALVGVTTPTAPTIGYPETFTNGFDTNNHDDNPSDYFFSDLGYTITKNNSGEAQFNALITTWAELQTALNQELLS